MKKLLTFLTAAYLLATSCSAPKEDHFTKIDANGDSIADTVMAYSKDGELLRKSWDSDADLIHDKQILYEDAVAVKEQFLPGIYVATEAWDTGKLYNISAMINHYSALANLTDDIDIKTTDGNRDGLFDQYKISLSSDDPSAIGGKITLLEMNDRNANGSFDDIWIQLPTDYTNTSYHITLGSQGAEVKAYEGQIFSHSTINQFLETDLE